MKERVAALAGAVGRRHALARHVPRDLDQDLAPPCRARRAKARFTILDTDDQIRLLKQVLQAENIDDKRWPARTLAYQIDAWKNRGLDPAQVPAGEAAAFANGKGGKLYGLYQERLKVLNAADFGDLLLECLRLFRENPDVLKQYQDRFRYMLVDEYQDTNTVQYLWLKLLAQGRNNVCCVGDDDQSIYGWRGADVDNILRFEKDFPGAKIIRLERNYRSTGAYSRRRRGSHRAQSGPARQDALHRRREGRQADRLRRLGFGRGSAHDRRGDRAACSARASGSTRSRSSCAPRSRCASSKSASSRSACPIASSAARASTSAPKSATRSPICGSSRSPTTISPSSASSMCRSAASATRVCSFCTIMRGASASR